MITREDLEQWFAPISERLDAIEAKLNKEVETNIETGIRVDHKFDDIVARLKQIENRSE